MHSCLITGGTGTLGQALARALLNTETARIVIFSRDEHKQFEMREAISDPRKRLRWFLGDVRDSERMRRAFHGVQCVFHAAAMKQVAASEFNPFEAVKTNILGSQNVIEAAIDCSVQKVLAISTDKAHNPTTLYGTTKLCAERLFLAANAYAGGLPPVFSVARFGNIAGSRGSVIPKWRSILASGSRSVPVSDPECTRYWITAEEAAKFTLGSLYAMRGGESFQPGMSAFQISDLAEAMGAEMLITGLGAGERLHEDGSESAPRLTVDQLKTLLKEIP